MLPKIISMKNYKDYNKQEIFNVLDNITIEKVANQVITKYRDTVINITNVSNRYEVFDIVKYLKNKIELIEKNFNIQKYSLHLTRGKQYLQLISDKIEVGGVEFYKSFYILNSTDKSRRLSFNVGLYSESKNFYIISANNASLTKKHLTGVTQAAEEASEGLNGETFDQQIESLNSLVGHNILFSNLRKVILGDKEEIPQVNHRKFDAFKNSIRFANSDGRISLTNEQREQLLVDSEKLTSVTHDFYISAFWAFQVYLSLFRKQDSHVIKNESERIMKITQWAVRNSVLEELGI